MVFNTTINNISVISRRPVLLVEETGVPGENHRPVASHWQTNLNIINYLYYYQLLKDQLDCLFIGGDPYYTLSFV